MGKEQKKIVKKYFFGEEPGRSPEPDEDPETSQDEASGRSRGREDPGDD